MEVRYSGTSIAIAERSLLCQSILRSSLYCSSIEEIHNVKVQYLCSTLIEFLLYPKKGEEKRSHPRVYLGRRSNNKGGGGGRKRKQHFKVERGEVEGERGGGGSGAISSSQVSTDGRHSVMASCPSLRKKSTKFEYSP